MSVTPPLRPIVDKLFYRTRGVGEDTYYIRQQRQRYSSKNQSYGLLIWFQAISDPLSTTTFEDLIASPTRPCLLSLLNSSSSSHRLWPQCCISRILSFDLLCWALCKYLGQVEDTFRVERNWMHNLKVRFLSMLKTLKICLIYSGPGFFKYMIEGSSLSYIGRCGTFATTRYRLPGEDRPKMNSPLSQRLAVVRVGSWHYRGILSSIIALDIDEV